MSRLHLVLLLLYTGAAAALHVPFTRRRALAACAAWSTAPPAFGSGAARAAANARAAERREAEAAAALPINQLRLARRNIDAAVIKLNENTGSSEKWADLRNLMAQTIASARSVGSTELLQSAKVVDQFAYDQQQRVWREKYPKGYDQFLARNANIDISEPAAALTLAEKALDDAIALLGQ